MARGRRGAFNRALWQRWLKRFNDEAREHAHTRQLREGIADMRRRLEKRSFV
jgi:hypothetical protein